MDLEDATCLEGDGLAIAGLVRRLAPAAYFGSEDLVALHTDEAQLIRGRLPEPERHDIALPVARAASVQRRLLGGGPDDFDPLTLHIEQLQIVQRGDRAEVDAAWTLFWGSGEDAFREGLRAELQRGPDGWRFTETRLHLLGSYFIDGPGDASAARYAALDARVTVAREHLRRTPTDEASRQLREALRAAEQLPAALELARSIAARPDATAYDQIALAQLAARFDEQALSRRARVAQTSAPLGHIRYAAPSLLHCANEAPYAFPEPDPERLDEDQPEPCAFEQVARVHVESGAPRDAAIVRVTRGFEQRQELRLLVGLDAEWVDVGWLGDGGARGSERGPLAFELSDLELLELIDDGPLEARMRYRSRYTSGEDAATITEETGWLICLNIDSDRTACARAPSRIEARSGSGPASVASASVTFGEGEMIVSEVEGDSPRLTAGTRSIHALFGD